MRCVSRSIRVIGSSSRSRNGALAASNRSRTRAVVVGTGSPGVASTGPSLARAGAALEGVPFAGAPFPGAPFAGAPSARATALPRPRSRSLTRSP
ncbi:hypothetical protein GCM10009573_09070 [Agromyces bracchium]